MRTAGKRMIAMGLAILFMLACNWQATMAGQRSDQRLGGSYGGLERYTLGDSQRTDPVDRAQQEESSTDASPPPLGSSGEDSAVMPGVPSIMAAAAILTPQVEMESILTGENDYFNVSETVKITLNFYHIGSIPAGETRTIVVSNNLSLLKTPDISIRNGNDNDRVIGYASIDAQNNSIVLTSTDTSANAAIVSGYMSFSATFNRNNFTDASPNTHRKTFTFQEVGGQTASTTKHVVIPEVTGSYHMLDKYGKYLENGRIQWYTQINYYEPENRWKLENIEITDTVGEGHKYVEGSLQVFTYSWVYLNGNTIYHGSPFEITNYELTPSPAGGFTLKLPGIDELDLSSNSSFKGLESIPYRLMYQTEITNDATQTYNNTAKLSATGVNRSSTGTVVVATDGGGTVKSVKLQVKKIDGITGDPLPDAEFALLHKKADEEEIQVASLVTGTDGTVTYEGPLQLNTQYLIREIHTPGAQYEPAEDQQVIFKSTEPLTQSIVIENYPAKQTAILEIRKLDEEGFRLSGAKFVLFRDRELTLPVEDKYGASIWTAGSGGQPGMVRIEGLPVGTYYLLEVEAPTGYLRDDTAREVTVLDNAGGITAVTIVNKRDEFSMVILKEDENTKALLSGAEFTAYRKSPSDTWVEVDTFSVADAQSGYVRKAIVGEYRLWENKAPDGYRLPNKYFDFVLTEQDKLYGKYTLIVPNSPKDTQGPDLASVRVYSHDEEDETKALAGAEFILYRQSGGRWEPMTGVTTGNTGLSGVIGDLPYGTYKIETDKDPEGYMAAVEEKAFDLSEENSAEEPKVIPVPYRIQTATLEIIKYDLDTDEPLSGAKFTLQQQNGEDYFVNSATGRDGGIVADNIPYGTYRLWEIEAPEGYYTAGGATEVVVDQNHVEIRVPNNPVDLAQVADVKLVKHTQGDRNSVLAGAKFDLEVYEGGSWETFLHGYVTDSKGEINVRNLPFGTYRVVEKEAPSGYEIINEYTGPLELTNNVNTTLYIPNRRIATEGSSGGRRDQSSGGTSQADTDRSWATSGSVEQAATSPGVEPVISEATNNPETGMLSAVWLQLLLGIVAVGLLVSGSGLMLLSRREER